MPSFPLSVSVSSMDVAEDSISLVEVFSKLHSVIGAPCEDAVTESALENHLITASLPFLRCAAFLFSNLTDVAAPPALHGWCFQLSLSVKLLYVITLTKDYISLFILSIQPH